MSFRDFTVDDYDNVHVYASDPEVTRYTGFGPNTPERTKGFLQFISGESSQTDRANYGFALIHKDTNQLIGSCSLMRSDTNGPQYSCALIDCGHTCSLGTQRRSRCCRSWGSGAKAAR
jgi:RimJ/RimL family protein N-acetyltransferase